MGVRHGQQDGQEGGAAGAGEEERVGGAAMDGVGEGREGRWR